MKPPLPGHTKSGARGLRRGLTSVEQVLWRQLRGGRLLGFKFRRQHPIPPYIVEFCCLQSKLIVELDGSQHGVGVDAERDRYLRSPGFEILRYWNNAVAEDLVGVLENVLSKLQDRTLTPSPSPGGRGEQESGATP